MRATQASKTASWVAAARTFGDFLPRSCQLCSDPYGVRFAEPWLQRLERRFRQHPELAQQLLLRTGAGTSTVFYMQLRTRFIDDAVRDFANQGGSQVVLLGAGYDSRALRLGRDFPQLTFYEVDHPATQAEKQQVLVELADAAVRFLRWDFQHEPMAQLPAALGALGHDRSAPTLTIWEGVTMYLDPAAIDASVAAIGAYSAPRSPLVFTYFDRARYLERPTLRARALRRLVASVGEPFRFGWSPASLSEWTSQRGFDLHADVDATELAQRFFPAVHRKWIKGDGRHFAIALRGH